MRSTASMVRLSADASAGNVFREAVARKPVATAEPGVLEVVAFP